MAQKIGAVEYFECSSKTRDGVREIFEDTTRLALLTTGKKVEKKQGTMAKLFGRFYGGNS